MPEPPLRRESPAAPLVAAGAFLALLLAPLLPGVAPHGLLPEPWLLALAALLATAGALHRPAPGLALGVGTAALPLVALRCGPLPAAWLAAVATPLALVLHRRYGRLAPAAPPERRGPLRLFGEAMRSALPALGAGALLAQAPRPFALAAPGVGLAILLAALAWAAGLAAFDAATSQPWTWTVAGRRLAERWPGLLIEATCFAAGALVAAVADGIGTAAALLLLTALAALAVEAARHARLLGLTERRADELQRLTRATERVRAQGTPLRHVAEQIRVECRNLLPFDWYEFESAGGEETPSRWSAGPDGALREGPAAPGAAPPPLPGFHRRGSWELIERELRAEGEPLARLRLWCDARRLEPAGQQLLDELLPQMGASVHRALLDREAKHDPLTGVAVRRVLESRLQAAFAHASEEGGALAIVMCDLDHFKRINDTHGHHAGDLALVEAARALDQTRREADLLCRYGGEEFTLLLEDTDGSTALVVAERLRRAVEAIDLRVEGRAIPLGLSAGVAAFPELHVKTGGELILLADEALYQAKRNGRNRCLLDEGGGRYRDPAGEELVVAERQPPKPPQIFA
ncbi:MAG: diguanylate cyclase [Acidobacteriota bacterium]